MTERFAVFGHIIQGMEHVQQIHLLPAEKERLQPPVEIRKVTIFSEDLPQARVACLDGPFSRGSQRP